MADPIIYGPSGVALFPNWPTSGNFGNQAPGTAFSPIAGDVLVTQGVGLRPAVRHSAVRGTIDLWATTGTGVMGGNLLVMLAGSENELTGDSIQLTVDSTNRVGFNIVALGATVATIAPAGSAIASGTKLHIVAKWDSITPSISITVNGTLTSATPSGAWPVQATSVVQVGYGTGFGVFTGAVNALQASEAV